MDTTSRRMASGVLAVAMLATACASSPTGSDAPVETVATTAHATTAAVATAEELADADAVVAFGTTLLEVARTGGDAVQRLLDSRGRGAYVDCAPAWAHELLDVASEADVPVTADEDLTRVEIGGVVVPVDRLGSRVLLAERPCVDEPLPQPVRPPPASASPSPSPASATPPPPVAVPDLPPSAAPPPPAPDPSWWRAELETWSGLMWDVHHLNEWVDGSGFAGRQAADFYQDHAGIVRDFESHFSGIVPPSTYTDAAAALHAGLEAWITELLAAAACAYEPAAPCDARSQQRSARGEAFRRVESATGIDLPD